MWVHWNEQAKSFATYFNEKLFCAAAENLPVERESKHWERDTVVPLQLRNCEYWYEQAVTTFATSF